MDNILMQSQIAHLDVHHFVFGIDDSVLFNCFNFLTYTTYSEIWTTY